MKFKTIFILFNAVVVFSFVFIFLFPLFLLGGEYTLGFWKSNWFLGAFFLVILGVLNGFFISNWKLFDLVEKEDWKALSDWLHVRIFEKGSFRSQYVRLYVNAAMLLSNLPAIDQLEALLREKKPKLLRRQAVLFGVGYLLRNDPDASITFFEPYLSASDVEARGWLWLDYSFSLILKNRAAEALPWLRKAASQRDSVLALLSVYLAGNLAAASLAPGAEKDAALAFAQDRRDGLRKRFTPERWSREVEKAKNDVHVVILSRLIDDAGRWLFDATAEKTAQ
jgi:hypothetical protein